MNYSIFLVSFFVGALYGQIKSGDLTPEDPFEKAIIQRQQSVKKIFKSIETAHSNGGLLPNECFKDPSLFHDFGPSQTEFAWLTPFATVVIAALNGLRLF